MSIQINPAEMRAGVASDVVREVAQRHKLTDIKIVDGFVNLVGIGEGRVVIKAPQPEEEDSDPKRLRMLAAEITNLEHLQTVKDYLAPTVVPELVDYSLDPAYLVATHVPGRSSVPAEEIKHLSTPKRNTLGHEYGAYIARQAAIPPTGVSAAERMWVPAFDRFVGNFSEPRYPVLTRKAAELYERWQTYRTAVHSGSVALKFIHGDLRLENSTLSDEYELLGVFDFATAGKGDIAEEVSPLLKIDDTALNGCMSELELSGLKPSPEHVRVWREMKDFHVLPAWITLGNTGHPNYIRLRNTIVERYPEESWEELWQT